MDLMVRESSSTTSPAAGPYSNRSYAEGSSAPPEHGPQEKRTTKTTNGDAEIKQYNEVMEQQNIETAMPLMEISSKECNTSEQRPKQITEENTRNQNDGKNQWRPRSTAKSHQRTGNAEENSVHPPAAAGYLQQAQQQKAQQREITKSITSHDNTAAKKAVTGGQSSQPNTATAAAAAAATGDGAASSEEQRRTRQHRTRTCAFHNNQRWRRRKGQIWQKFTQYEILPKSSSGYKPEVADTSRPRWYEPGRKEE